MTPNGCVRSDLSIYQGTDYKASVKVSGGPLDGYTAKAQIRREPADICPEVAVEIGTTIEGGVILLFIPHAETQPLTGNYVWDLKLTSPEDEIFPLMWGKVDVIPEVTHIT